jgi:pyridoxal 5'-phosphate synthase pdxS subunit
MSACRRVTMMGDEELVAYGKEIGAPFENLKQVRELGKLPVPNFAAGGIATPADAALMMQLGAEAVFVGSGIFKSDDPIARAQAIVIATTHFRDPKKLAEVSTGLMNAMPGLDVRSMREDELLATRGW